MAGGAIGGGGASGGAGTTTAGGSGTPVTGGPVSAAGVLGPDTRVEAGGYTSGRYYAVTCRGPANQLAAARAAVLAVVRDVQAETSTGLTWGCAGVPTSPWTPRQLAASIAAAGGGAVVVEVRRTGATTTDALLAGAGRTLGRAGDTVVGAYDAAARGAGGVLSSAASGLGEAGETLSFWARWGPVVGVAVAVLAAGLAVWLLLRALRYLASPEAGRAIGNVGGIKKVLQ